MDFKDWLKEQELQEAIKIPKTPRELAYALLNPNVLTKDAREYRHGYRNGQQMTANPLAINPYKPEQTNFYQGWIHGFTGQPGEMPSVA